MYTDIKASGVPRGPKTRDVRVSDTRDAPAPDGLMERLRMAADQNASLYQTFHYLWVRATMHVLYNHWRSKTIKFLSL